MQLADWFLPELERSTNNSSRLCIPYYGNIMEIDFILKIANTVSLKLHFQLTLKIS